MLQLTNLPISPATQTFIDARQVDINSKANFVLKSARAQALWGSKEASNQGRTAFEEIKNRLIGMCVGIEICNYCEQSEASDIEHILPKSFFPEQAFVWGNYLLACKNCNSGYKLDKFWVFDPAGSVTVAQLIREHEPFSQEIAFINLRSENPLELMQLSFDDFLFYARPPHRLGTQGYQKVEKTLEILKLNDRSALVRYRKAAFRNYKRLLKEYVASKNATNHDELEEAISGDPQIDHQLPFSDEQARVMEHIRRSVLESEHPTVWREMCRQQSALSPQLQHLFTASGALNW